MTISNEQLAELVKTVNTRLDEFNIPPGVPIFDGVSVGVVRIMHDVIMEWLDGGDPDERDEWKAGFQKGLKTGFDSVRGTAVARNGEEWYEMRLQEFSRGYEAARKADDDGGSPGDVDEGDRGGHRRFEAVSPDGRTFTINGDPKMDEETKLALDI